MSTDQPATRSVAVGDVATDFALPTRSGGSFSLRDLLGDAVIVLYFYPRDDTPGCRAEACAFREVGAAVAGISSDPVTSHQRFAAKHALPFLLLSDAGGAVRKRYGVRATLGLLPGRVTYAIDRGGVVRRICSPQFAATRHVPEALQVVLITGAVRCYVGAGRPAGPPL